MNIHELATLNDEKYIGFKSYCNSLKGYNHANLDCRYTDSDQNDLTAEDKLSFAIESIKDFNINDIVHNYHCPYRYTTVLEFVLRTDKYQIINYMIKRFYNEIKNEIYIDETLSYDLLTVLYSNLNFDNCVTDTITPLVFKFENLDFINVIEKFEQKIIVLRYFINQKDNYPCSDNFLNSIYLKYQEVLQKQEQLIFKKFTNYVVQTQAYVNELISDLKYVPSEDMKEFHKLIKSLQNNPTE